MLSRVRLTLSHVPSKSQSKMASIEEVHVSDDAEFTDWKTARDTLRDIRETERRDSRVVVALGKILIDKYSNKLGDEGTLLLL